MIYVFLKPERRKSGLLKYRGYQLFLIYGSLECLHELHAKTIRPECFAVDTALIRL